MKVRIVDNPAGYAIEVKKHFWSSWKTKFFTGMSSSAILIANSILGEEVNPMMKEIIRHADKD